MQVALDGTADGRAETRTVTTGETSGNQIEITSGLAAGDQVLVELGGFARGAGGGNFQLPEGGFPGGAPPAGGFPSGGAQPAEEGNP